MANTGIKQVTTLQEGQMPCPPCTPLTGNTKPNIIGDPNYIEPYLDLTACPVTVDFTCPTIAATGGNDIVTYEVYVPVTVTANPDANKIKIKVMDATNTTEQASVTINLPFTPQANYNEGTITGAIPAGTHVISVEYLNSADVVQATCNNVVTGIVTT